MHDLPPLNAVRAFEAAARHLSLTKAGAELFVTHGAISRQVAALEEHLGVPLFVRGSRGITLTVDGSHLAMAASKAFQTLSSVTTEIGVRRRTTPFRLDVPPVFAMWWLIPRLGSLHQADPELSLDISTSIYSVDFGSGKYDAAVRRIGKPPDGLVTCSFLDARPIPVCSPRYKERYALRRFGDLARADLLSTKTEPDAWRNWLEMHKVRREPEARRLDFEQMYLALQAAIDSLGVALAPEPLVQNELAQGRLCALAKPKGPRSLVYALLVPPGAEKRREVSSLGKWLARQGELPRPPN